MSDSIAKYKELMEEGLTEVSPEQRRMNNLVEILEAAHRLGILPDLLKKSQQMSQEHKNISALSCFQYMADELRIE